MFWFDYSSSCVYNSWAGHTSDITRTQWQPQLGCYRGGSYCGDCRWSGNHSYTRGSHHCPTTTTATSTFIRRPSPAQQVSFPFMLHSQFYFYVYSLPRSLLFSNLIRGDLFIATSLRGVSRGWTSLSFMVALCNRETIYIFILFLLLSSFFFLFFSSPNLSSRRLDVYHTLAHGVVLV